MRWFRALSDIRSLIGWRGWLRALRAVPTTIAAGLRNVRSALRRSRRSFLFVMDDSVTLDDSARRAAAHRFVLAAAGDLERFRESIPDYVLHEAGYLPRGDRCLLQLAGDRLVGMTWVGASQLAHVIEGVHYNLPNDCFHSYMGYTLPEWRGQGFQPLRKLRLLEALSGEGKRWLFGSVDELAMPAIRGTRRSGDLLAGTLQVGRHRGRVRVEIDVREEFWCDARRV